MGQRNLQFKGRDDFAQTNSMSVSWCDANTFTTDGFASTYVAEPFLPAGPADDGREIRKLIAGLLDEFDTLQGKVEDVQQRLSNGDDGYIGDPHEDLSLAIRSASERYLNHIERCRRGLERIDSDGGLSAAGRSLQGLLPKIKSIWTLCDIHLEEGSIAPRIFMWMREHCLQFYEHDTAYPLYRVSQKC
jgi:hypothetical protein